MSSLTPEQKTNFKKKGGTVSEKIALMEAASNASSAATKTTYFGAGSSVAAWFMQFDVLPWLGFFIALAGFIVNLYYKQLENKRAEELHNLTMSERKKNENN